MLSFKNDQTLKDKLLEEGKYHAKHNMIGHVGYGNGLTGSNFKGCTIGCYAGNKNHGGDRHGWVALHYGLPKRLCQIVDPIYEGLPRDGQDQAWHIQWGSAIPVGVSLHQLELICDKLILFATQKKAEWSGSTHNKHLRIAASLYERRIAGNEPTEQEWEKAALAARAALAALAALAARAALAALAALDARDARAALAALDARDARAARAALDALDALDCYYIEVRDEYLRLMDKVGSP